MANLKELRSRISSVSSTMQITNAMKMVSAAKLSKAQEAITATRPYADKLGELLQNLSSSSEGASSPYAEKRTVKNILLIAISSNRGLAGAFNSNIVKRINTLTQENFRGQNVKVLALGKKAGDVLRHHQDIVETNTQVFDKLHFNDAAAVAEQIMEAFVAGAYDQVILVYNRFINAATQQVMAEPFLPLQAKTEPSAEPQQEIDYIFSPDKDYIIQELIPKSLKIQLFKALRDSVAAEHGARMTAMHKATDNATELKAELTLHYNKARQAAITNEILEIVGGAEALNN